ncbi:hypothetical protein BpHYR1_035691 [Brachionus plicatilis]|uniref:Uncharacterized protein n=1 Tax=Brachionus plicatilis TaxID=10195 RepID=A0A3M7QLI5_BRAPC|nr:hypothetical protein BpHYR1_035691 [Brachionus plicatilis]
MSKILFLNNPFGGQPAQFSVVKTVSIKNLCKIKIGLLNTRTDLCILNHDISYTLLLQPSHVNMSHNSFFRNHYNVIRTYINNLSKSGQKDPSVFLYLGLERIKSNKKIKKKMDKKGQKDPTGFLVLNILLILSDSLIHAKKILKN